MRALQIIIPVYNNPFAQKDDDEEPPPADFAEEKLTDYVMDMLGKLGEIEELIGEASGFGGGEVRVFDGGKSVGMVDVDEQHRVLPKRKKKKSKKRGRR